jgi:osmotically-inducible protein OsmY
MATCQFCELPIKQGQRFCANCGKVISEAPSVDSIDAYLDRPESAPAFPSTRPGESAIYPASKSTFEPAARYWEKNGTPLEKVETYVLPRFDPEGSSEGLSGKAATAGQARKDPGIKKRGFKAGKWLVVVVFIFAGVLAAYFYTAGFPGSTAGAEEYLNKVLKTRGFDVTAKMEGGGGVVVTGKVQSDDERNAVLAIIRSHSKVKGITDSIKVTLSPAEMEQSLNKILDGAGLGEVKARVGADFITTLSGTVQDRQGKDAVLALAKDQRGVKGVNDSLEIKRPSVQDRTQETTSDFTQTALFKVFALSPSAWASKKYSSSVTFRVPGPGRILMEADWEQHGALALILSNAESHDTYAQKDGKNPLKLVYKITPQDLTKGSLWEAVVANFTSTGPMDGSLKITFLAGDANRPFSSFLEQAFDVNRLEGEINSALRTEGIKGVTAEVAKNRTVTLTGSVKSLGEKQKAIETAKRFKAIKQVKDIIFVVG